MLAITEVMLHACCAHGAAWPGRDCITVVDAQCQWNAKNADIGRQRVGISRQRKAGADAASALSTETRPYLPRYLLTAATDTPTDATAWRISCSETPNFSVQYCRSRGSFTLTHHRSHGARLFGCSMMLPRKASLMALPQVAYPNVSAASVANEGIAHWKKSGAQECRLLEHGAGKTAWAGDSRHARRMRYSLIHRSSR